MKVEEEAIDFKEWWDAIWKKRFLFIALFISINALALILTLFVRNQYKATATFFITSTKSDLGLSQLGGLIGMGLDPSKPTIDQLIGILESRLLAKKVMEKVGIQEVVADFRFVGKNKQGLTPEDLNKMAKILKDSIIVKNTKQFIILEVPAFSPQMAVVLANAYVDELGRYLNEASLNFNFHLLDEPITPIGRFKPSLRKNALIATFLAGIIFVSYVAFTKNKEK